ncbi:hypothetical protein ACFW5D_13490 [Streptomyces sp. NPDC058770]|uniref:hypothetical protein n=1 Tax=Streptomyces sp. NPDC058770 TaxID=3346631 RepID=UPI0036CBE9FA
MDKKKWLLLSAVLIVAAAVTLALTLGPGDEDERPAQSLCFGSLSEATAALIDDGKGGTVSTDEQEKKGQGDLAVLKMCFVMRDNASSDTKRGVYSLIVEDTRSVPGARKDSVPLGGGIDGWALPDTAVPQLPTGCARRMGSTAPHITVTLNAPSQEEKKGIVDRDTAIRNSAAVVRESAANLARSVGC